MADPTIVLKILADVQKAVAGLKDVTGSVAGVEKAFGSMALPAGAALGAIAGGAAIASKAASDLEQSQGAVESVFKDSAGAVEEFGKASAQANGLAQSDYQQMAAVVGAQLKGMGTDTDKLAGQTDNLIDIASDLAATFGGDTATAVEAVSALLRGERDPIEKYGVSIKQVDVDARLAADGIVTMAKASGDLRKAHAATEKATKAYAKALKDGDPVATKAARATLTQAQHAEKAAASVKGLTADEMKAATAQATLALLTAKTTDAQGAFSREVDTAAHTQQVANAQIKDATAALGVALLPIIVMVTGQLGDLATVVRDNATAFQVIVGIVALVAAGILAVNVAFKVYRAATLAVTAAQWLLNAAMTANPIGIVVVAVAALAAGLVLLWQNSETFRTIVTAAFNAVLGVVQTVVAWITDAFGKLGVILAAPWKVFQDAVAKAVAAVRSIIDSMAKWIDGIFAGIRAAAKTIGDAVDAVNPFGAPPPAARTASAVAGPWSRLAARSGGGGGGGGITVNVYTTGDSIEAEQAVVRAVRRAQRLNAGRVLPAFGVG
jgi:hypothetical protein